MSKMMLDRMQDARRDLERALELQPADGDRAQIVEMLQLLAE
jgi:hypothetical protein